MNRKWITIACAAALLAALTAGCSDEGPPTGVGVDTTPPAPITDAVLSYSADTEAVRLEWSAPYDDAPGERIAAYDIRYTLTRGYEPSESWDLLTPVPDPPTPGEPGTRQGYTFENIKRARDLYVGIRGVDENGNRSARGDLASVHIPGFSFEGRCVDVFTGEPVQGFDVTLTSGTEHHCTTDADGRFEHDAELDNGVTYVDIQTGNAASVYHHLRQPFVLDGDSVHTFVMIPVVEVTANWIPNLLALTKYMSRTTSTVSAQNGPQTAPSPTILANWHTRPVPCYAPPFVNDVGVDYRLAAEAAAQRWMDRTGEPLFTFVDAPPDTGIVLTYKPSSSMGGIAFTVHTRGDDGHPIRDEIRIINDLPDSATTWLVFLHEFGHTIQLGHVNDRNFIMYVSGPLPHDVSDDEVMVVRLHEALPTRIDMAIYDEENTP
ncbi:MAG: hypothetical protein P8181_03370 [bacterium]